MKLHQKNIFISTSCVIPKCEFTFSREERLEHLIKTIDSCKDVPNHLNVISEGSSISIEEKQQISEKALLITYENDNAVQELTKVKQLGAIVLWIRALENLEIDDDTNIFFLSGRYLLLDGFDLSLFEGDYVFKKPWFTEQRGGWYGLQLFKISGRKKDEFLSVLNESLLLLINGQAPDVECAVYKSIQNKNIFPTEIEKVYCGGNVGINRNFEIH